MPSLIALKNLIRQRKVANLQSLADYFKTSTEVLLPMLSLLVAKGYICERKGVNCGSKCNRCDIKAMKIYYWQDQLSTI